MAAIDDKAGTLSVGLINYSPGEQAFVALRLSGVAGNTRGAAWRIDGPSLAAINVPGQPEGVTTAPLPGPVALDKPLVLPPHSITLLEVKLPAR